MNCFLASSPLLWVIVIFDGALGASSYKTWHKTRRTYESEWPNPQRPTLHPESSKEDAKEKKGFVYFEREKKRKKEEKRGYRALHLIIMKS